MEAEGCQSGGRGLCSAEDHQGMLAPVSCGPTDAARPESGFSSKPGFPLPPTTATPDAMLTLSQLQPN